VLLTKWQSGRLPRKFRTTSRRRHFCTDDTFAVFCQDNAPKSRIPLAENGSSDAKDQEEVPMIQIKKILCPIDFFPASLKAFDYALKLAANYEAGIFALHVVSPIVPTFYDFPLNLSEYTGALQKQSRHELAKLGKKAEKLNVPFRSEVVIGSTDAEIHKALKKSNSDFVIMGTHGRKGLERWILGSEADRMIRSCPVPLLTLGAAKGTRSSPPAIRSILVTTDFSEGTADALKYAFSLAQECQARLTLLHVVDQVTVESSVKSSLPTIDAIRGQLEKVIPDDVRPWCDVKTRVEVGMPYRTILAIQKSEKADLLVMNVHGKSLIDRALLGSTAERVVRAAVCPVLLIPPVARKGKRKPSRRK
jgi:nucleotide-binding universal stress UspA family protein